MISLIDYDEFGPNMGYKSMRDFLKSRRMKDRKR